MKNKKKKGVNNLTFGLFRYRGKYFWRNIKDIKIWLKRICFLLKHGYCPQANWETYTWFIDVMKEIFDWYIDNRNGYPASMTEQEYENLLYRLRNFLDDMDETNERYDKLPEDMYKQMKEAKDEFFKLFNEHFYSFWD